MNDFQIKQIIQSNIDNQTYEEVYLKDLILSKGFTEEEYNKVINELLEYNLIKRGINPTTGEKGIYEVAGKRLI